MNTCRINKGRCSVDGCRGPAEKAGLCNKHYLRKYRYGDVNFTKIRRYDHSKETCAVPGCNRRIRKNGYCTLHVQRVMKHGDPSVCLTRKKGETGSYVEGEIAHIELTQGKWAIIDAKHFKFINQYLWCYHEGYATAHEDGKELKMHRLIAGTPAGLDPDHKSHDTLDNREANLRPATPVQSARNRRPRKHHQGLPTSSRYKGVGWHKGVKAWYAAITVHGRAYHLGYSQSEEDCAILYNVAAQLLFGEFAWLNPV